MARDCEYDGGGGGGAAEVVEEAAAPPPTVTGLAPAATPMATLPMGYGGGGSVAPPPSGGNMLRLCICWLMCACSSREFCTFMGWPCWL